MSAVKFSLSRQAEHDIREIEDYSAHRGSDKKAADYVRGLFAAFEKLAQRPGIGRARPDIPPPYLVYTVGSHLIIYRYNPKLECVEILNVLHPAMDIEKRLSEAIKEVHKGDADGTR
ncbi:type II toxin-antitoxin system RelE/ParE family toxin [Asticcacaulis sp. ZE23SCel15]|uniref:type II toxin-antitoxin system RelE/ParE family toxin n=1 Tax=Asticcacaulis sp. ZE23SCel15 TaxID=3059027 RepID=UPI0026602C76|nr:type II toxin-antitoxin system RelE/ParE family toxin [Asticcacaulis sp. ZE23SCel15]WKL57198.1 type II toxin-antitoxin system RelE/ParE family toxin [Asticcacaulis sp. ZE23SCel15]